MKPKIHLNQIGYICELPKTAAIIGTASTFTVHDERSGAVVFEGTLEKPKVDIASGDAVSTADFSSLRRSGKYYIKVGSTKSYTFKIAENPYEELENALMRGIYYARCGTSLQPQFAGRFKRKKCHIEPTPLYSDPSVIIDTAGGWHDSGDYGKYVVPTAVILGHLLYAFELFPSTFDKALNIPESGNKFPDILNQAKWGLDWLLKMQAKDGGVYHKVSAVDYADNVMPSDDKEKYYVFDKSSSATMFFTAATALASRIFKRFDIDYATTLKIAAINAWAWTMNNKDIRPFANPANVVTAEYSDENLNDENFWAVAEMYRLTGEQAINKRLCEIFDRVDTTSFTCKCCSGFGAISYICGSQEKDEILLDALQTAFIYRADTLVSMSRHSEYGTAKEGNRYTYGSNLDILNHAMTLIIANEISKKDEYLATILEEINYILGKNPMGISYITGYGENSCMHPQHRPSTADKVDDPIPGYVVSGPDMNRGDEYSRWLIKKGTPPTKCYIDVEYSYSTNSVALQF
ncbi:MAG: glycoside hydrolase family 9 protein, partial [Oscillospiraceae bacterium]